jgi:hypothetical protein
MLAAYKAGQITCEIFRRIGRKDRMNSRTSGVTSSQPPPQQAILGYLQAARPPGAFAMTVHLTPMSAYAMDPS